jgi:hypothetical protein
MSKRLVNMMGGEIWVDSKLGQGKSFNFTANFGLAKEKVKKRLVPSSDLRGMKVLVVDDSATLRNILQDILESAKQELFSAFMTSRLDQALIQHCIHHFHKTGNICACFIISRHPVLLGGVHTSSMNGFHDQL